MFLKLSCVLIYFVLQVSAGPEDSEVTIYEHPNYKGWSATYKLNSSACVNIEPDKQKMASSMKLNCNCIKLYDTKDCAGDLSRVYFYDPANIPDFIDPQVDFDNQLVSFSQCTKEEIDEGNKQLECGENWTSFGDRCYRFIYELENISPSQAPGLCYVSGGQLASIRNENENDFLTNLVENAFFKFKVNDTQNVLTGGQRVVGNLWKWENSDDAFTYNDWGTGEPNGPKSTGDKMFIMYNRPKNPNWGKWGAIDNVQSTRPLCMKVKNDDPCADKKRGCGNQQKSCKEFGECTPGSDACVSMDKKTVVALLQDCGCPAN